MTISSIINIKNELFFNEIKNAINIFNNEQYYYVKMLLCFLNEYDLINIDNKNIFNKLFNKLKIIKSIKWINKYNLNIHNINI